jgi:zinc transporter 1/2/3
MFEGIALGSRIASIGKKPTYLESNQGSITPTEDKASTPIHTCGPAVNAATVAIESPLSVRDKLLMVLAFSVVTPIGMAIGIGVLHRFNGNDRSTLIVLGTLDALSAGILIWVGIGKFCSPGQMIALLRLTILAVEMWARDWMNNGELAAAGAVVTCLGLFGLVAGMVLMSFLGKWA